METSMVMIFGVLTLLLRAGYALYISGSVRSKNASGIVLRIAIDTALTTLVFWAIGAAILLQQNNPWFGVNPQLLLGQSHETAQNTFFHLSIVLIGGAIVIGGLAERARFYAGLVVSVVLAGFVIPVAGHWVWFGWLKSYGFIDVGGAAAIHLPSAVFAAIGILFIGARTGKYNVEGHANSVPGHSLPMAGIGVGLILIAWVPYVLGCVMTHGGLMMFEGSALGVAAMNVLLAAAAGLIVAVLYGQLRYGKPDIFFASAGMLGALVAISAGAAAMGNIGALITGAIAGLIVPLVSVELDTRLHFDDPVDVVAIHGIGAVWGIIAAGLFAPIETGHRLGAIAIQLVGILSVLLLSAIVAVVLFGVLRVTRLLRVSEQDELDGLDLAEHDINGYPDFQQNTIKSYHLREL